MSFRVWFHISALKALNHPWCSSDSLMNWGSKVSKPKINFTWQKSSLHWFSALYHSGTALLKWKWQKYQDKNGLFQWQLAIRSFSLSWKMSRLCFVCLHRTCGEKGISTFETKICFKLKACVQGWRNKHHSLWQAPKYKVVLLKMCLKNSRHYYKCQQHSKHYVNTSCMLINKNIWKLAIEPPLQVVWRNTIIESDALSTCIFLITKFPLTALYWSESIIICQNTVW